MSKQTSLPNRIGLALDVSNTPSFRHHPDNVGNLENQADGQYYSHVSCHIVFGVHNTIDIAQTVKNLNGVAICDTHSLASLRSQSAIVPRGFMQLEVRGAAQVVGERQNVVEELKRIVQGALIQKVTGEKEAHNCGESKHPKK